MSSFTDKVIKCVDCAQDFAFTVDEQEYYRAHNLPEPIRCPMCRAAHKAAAADGFKGKRQ